MTKFHRNQMFRGHGSSCDRLLESFWIKRNCESHVQKPKCSGSFRELTKRLRTAQRILFWIKTKLSDPLVFYLSRARNFQPTLHVWWCKIQLIDKRWRFYIWIYVFVCLCLRLAVRSIQWIESRMYVFI